MRTALVVLLGAACVAAIALGDAMTDMRVSLALFHVLPISYVAWVAGMRPAMFVTTLAVIASLLVDLHAGLPAVDGDFVFAWATFNRFLIDVAAVVLFDRLRDSHLQLARLAKTDELTGLLNRRAFHERFEEEVRRCRRQTLPLTIAMLDLNGFKAVNDSLGHATGDKVLKLVGELLQQLRSGEVAARLGGDEFAVLFPNTCAPAARAAIDRVMHELEHRVAAQRWVVSCSAGIAEHLAADASCEEALHRADLAMYEQKRSGVHVST